MLNYKDSITHFCHTQEQKALNNKILCNYVREQKAWVSAKLKDTRIKRPLRAVQHMEIQQLRDRPYASSQQWSRSERKIV